MISGWRLPPGTVLPPFTARALAGFDGACRRLDARRRAAVPGPAGACSISGFAEPHVVRCLSGPGSLGAGAGH